MKSAISLALVVALITPAVPVAAQERMEPGAGPIHRAMASAALRLAAEDLTPSAIQGTLPGGKSGQSDWSRVHEVEGEEVTITVRGSPPAKRYVVRGTVGESGLTVLNLTDPTIPAAVADVLADAARLNPESFTLARRGTFRLNKHVRLAPDGVFLDDRKAIELDQVVEQLARDSVAEISYLHRYPGKGMAWGLLIGGAVGLAVVIGSCGTHWNRETDSCGNLTGAWLVLGPIWGAALGGLTGATDKISTVVYRAPQTIDLPAE